MARKIRTTLDLSSNKIINLAPGTLLTDAVNLAQLNSAIIELATQAEVNAGTDTTRAVTPATLQVKLNAIPSVASATETNEGTAEIATTAEVLAGTDDARFVTPLKLDAKLATIPRIFAQSVTISSTPLTVTHNLGTDDLVIEVYETGTKETIICDVKRSGANAITLTGDANSTTCRVVVIG